MPLRLRLIALVLLFVSAVLLNISALIFLARAVSDSLDVIERVRERQLTAAQLDGYLRDAEAALYRYQIEGERGFTDQFTVFAPKKVKTCAGPILRRLSEFNLRPNTDDAPPGIGTIHLALLVKVITGSFI